MDDDVRRVKVAKEATDLVRPSCLPIPSTASIGTASGSSHRTPTIEDEGQESNADENRKGSRQSLLEHLASHLRARAERMNGPIIEPMAEPLEVHRNEEFDEEAENHPLGTGYGQTFEMPVKKVLTKKAIPIKTVELNLNGAKKTRKSDARKSTKAKTKSIQSYRPGYLWNRGGHGKELRIRCMARKYLHIWKRKVFGRVLPSVARRMYRCRLLKVTFGAWNLMWWEARREWGLTIRADLHNKYRITTVVWRAWQDFTISRRSKTQRKKLAIEYSETIQKHKCLDSWMKFIRRKRENSSLKKVADNFRCRSLVQRAMSEWIVQYQSAVEKQGLNNLALQFWAQNSTNKAWNIWSDRLRKRRLMHSKMLTAVKHAQSKLESKCLRAWLLYVENRKKKQQLYEYARGMHQQLIALRYFTLWQRAFKRQQEIQSHAQQMHHLADQSVLRRHYLHWKHYIVLCKEKREKELTADRHHCQQIVITSFSAWKLYVTKSKTQVIRKEIASDFRKRKLVECAFNLWQFRVEEREDAGLQPQIEAAQAHHSVILLMRMMERWKKYAEWRRHRKAQYEEADAYRQSILFPRILNEWHLHASLQSWKRKHQAIAQQTLRRRLCKRYYERWLNALQVSQDGRLLQRMAVLHHERSLVSTVFFDWKEKAQLRMQEAFKMDVAEEYREASLLRSYFSLWQQYVDDSHQSVTNFQKACRHHRQRQMYKSFSAWKQHLEALKEKKRLKEKAESHLRIKLLTWTLTAWKQYQQNVLLVTQRADIMHCTKNNCRLRLYFTLWHQNAVDQRKEFLSLQMADTFRANRILNQTFHEWRSWSAMHVYKKQQTALQVHEASKALQSGILRRSFHSWKNRTAVSLNEAALMRRANKLHSRVIIRKGFDSWKEFVHLCHSKRLLQKQGAWFHSMRLQAKYLLLWKEAQNDAQVQQEKNCLALWHWSLSLQRKVLHNWWLFAAERRRISERTAVALAARRRRLLREGAVHWLSVASDMSELRQKFAVSKGTQHYYRVHQVVIRCAAIWRKRTRERSRDKRPARVAYRAPPVISSVGLPQNILLPHSALERPVVAIARPSPRQPSYLMESLKREGLFHEEPKDEIEVVKFEDPSEPSELEEPSLHTQEEATLLLPHLGEPFQPQLDSTPQIAESDVSFPRSIVPIATGISTATKVELLPPTAFMFARDGAPLVQDADTTQDSVTSALAKIPVDQMKHDSAADELIFIRNKLKQHQQSKRTLKRAESDRLQLQKWISGIDVAQMSDPDCTAIMEELDKLEVDIAELKEIISADKSKIKSLTIRAKTLVPSMQ